MLLADDSVYVDRVSIASVSTSQHRVQWSVQLTTSGEWSGSRMSRWWSCWPTWWKEDVYVMTCVLTVA